MSRSTQFNAILDTLPSEAQLSLVQSKLVPLLDSDTLPPSLLDSILLSAQKTQTRFSNLPSLNLSAKKEEISRLLDELAKDEKRTLILGSGNRDEIVQEVVDSISCWVNDIWSSVFEFRAQYALAHQCLLYCATVLDSLGSTRGGCNCHYYSMPISITLKRHHARGINSSRRRPNKRKDNVHTFSFKGADRLDTVLLWIWRDLTLCALASPHTRALVPDILFDIQDAMGSGALERLLVGGYRDEYRDNPHFDPNEFDLTDDEDFTTGKYALPRNTDSYSTFGMLGWSRRPDLGGPVRIIKSSELDSGSSSSEDEAEGGAAAGANSGGRERRGFELIEDDPPQYFPRQYAKHWPESIHGHVLTLKQLITARLESLFTVHPSSQLWFLTIALAPDFMAQQSRLTTILLDNAISSPDTLVAALEIFTHREPDPERLMFLLKKYDGLLRPERDWATWQGAVVLVEKLDPTWALGVVKREMLDSVKAVRRNLGLWFGGLDRIDKGTDFDMDEDPIELFGITPPSSSIPTTITDAEPQTLDPLHTELTQIMQMRVGSQARRDRIERWIDQLCTPGGGGGEGVAVGPAAMAQIMLSFGIGVGVGGGAGVQAPGAPGGGGGGGPQPPPGGAGAVAAGGGGAGGGGGPPGAPGGAAAAAIAGGGGPAIAPLPPAPGGAANPNAPLITSLLTGQLTPLSLYLDTLSPPPPSASASNATPLNPNLPPAPPVRGDPDLEDLRDIYRPRLGERFEGWVRTAQVVKGGGTLLMKMAGRMIAMKHAEGGSGWGMGWVVAGDVVEAMVARLSDSRSKAHICDGLEAISNFYKIQSKKLAIRQVASGPNNRPRRAPPGFGGGVGGYGGGGGGGGGGGSGPSSSSGAGPSSSGGAGPSGWGSAGAGGGSSAGPPSGFSGRGWASRGAPRGGWGAGVFPRGGGAAGSSSGSSGAGGSGSGSGGSRGGGGSGTTPISRGGAIARGRGLPAASSSFGAGSQAGAAAAQRQQQQASISPRGVNRPHPTQSAPASQVPSDAMDVDPVPPLPTSTSADDNNAIRNNLDDLHIRDRDHRGGSSGGGSSLRRREGREGGGGGSSSRPPASFDDDAGMMEDVD